MPEAGRGGAGADGASSAPRPAVTGDWRGPLEQWCRDAGADVLVHGDDRTPDGDLRELRPGPRAVVVGLPGTLETVADPAELLAELAARGAPVAAAVTWRPSSPADAVRSLHPASLVGLLDGHFRVTGMELRDGVLGARAEVEGDAGARHRANEAAVVGVQADLEAALGVVLRDAAASDAHRGAAAELHAALVRADEDHFAARKARNDARAKLRDERDAAQARGEERERRIAHLEEQLAAAVDRAERLDARLSRIVDGRWWQIGEVVSDVRQEPRRVASAPARLWRAARRGS